jgi:hypothetical protein
MHYASDKPRLNFSTEIEIVADEYWVVVTIKENTRESFWDEMPQTVRARCQKDSPSIHVIRILARNLVLAKMYKDYILVGLLKQQTAQNEVSS